MLREFIKYVGLPPLIGGVPKDSLWNTLWPQRDYVIQAYYTGKWFDKKLTIYN